METLPIFPIAPSIENYQPKKEIKKMYRAKSVEEAVARYGPIQNHVWGRELQWMILLHTPDWFATCVINSATAKGCDKIYMNKDLQEPFLAAIEAVKKAGLEGELKRFDGCWNVRDVRGMPGHQSLHSYGLALDFRAADMPLGSESLFTPEFVKCFTDLGFAWGGDFSRKDPQHFSWGYEN